MARLLSYKRKDENRYSTFGDVGFFGKSTENLTTKVQPKKVKMSESPSVHKKTTTSVDVQKRSISLKNIKSRKRMRRWITATCLPSLRRWVKNILCCCCLCCCKHKKDTFEDDDVDRVVEEYCKQQQLQQQQQQQLSEGNESQKSTLKSNQSSGDVLWRWDESWKSNSDKFLETLELEGIGSDRSLKRAAEKLRAKNSKVRKSAMHNGGGG